MKKRLMLVTLVAIMIAVIIYVKPKQYNAEYTLCTIDGECVDATFDFIVYKGIWTANAVEGEIRINNTVYQTSRAVGLGERQKRQTYYFSEMRDGISQGLKSFLYLQLPTRENNYFELIVRNRNGLTDYYGPATNILEVYRLLGYDMEDTHTIGLER